MAKKKFRSSLDVSDFLNEESVRRKKEIITLKNFVFEKKNKQKIIDTLVKSLIIIAYSHWEGFVKESAQAYICYIKFLDKHPSDLNSRLYSALIFHEILGLQKSKSDKIAFINSTRTTGVSKISYPIATLIDTESNLNSEVLATILTNIGLDNTEFSKDSLFIDRKLLKLRNEFAHGELTTVITPEDAIEIADNTISLIDQFRTILDNALTLKSFLAHS